VPNELTLSVATFHTPLSFTQSVATFHTPATFTKSVTLLVDGCGRKRESSILDYRLQLCERLLTACNFFRKLLSIGDVTSGEHCCMCLCEVLNAAIE
jgi:hypothetical protein